MSRTNQEFPWLPVLAAFFVIGLLSATGAVSMQRLEARPVELWPTLASSIPPWIFWGLAARPIFALTRRFPIGAPFRPGHLAVHALFAVVLIVAQSALTTSIGRAVYPLIARDQSWGYWLGAYLSNRAVWNLLVYSGLVGLFNAIDTRNRLRQQELSQAHLEAELARAQLHGLQLQLQPHFLFNTLHAIGVLNQHDPASATRMIASLGDLLRSSLDNRAAKEIPLEKELALLEHYVEIESVRFSDRLRVSIDVAPELKPHLVPTFSLQPLVENAVRHGVARSTGASEIRISARAGDGRLRLSIWNTGPAIDVERLVEGVGLATTRDRLRRLYGDEGRLELENRDGGVEVTVRLPVHDNPVL